MFAKRILPPARKFTLLMSLMFVAQAGAADYRVTDLGTLGGPTSTAIAINRAGDVVGESWLAAGDRAHAFLWDGHLVDLGELPNAPQSIGFGINDNGTIVGSAYSLGDLENHAIQWMAGSPAEIGMFLARGINNAGIVVGSAAVDLGGMNYVTRAVIWTAGIPTELGTLGGEHSEAFAISNLEWVVGSSTVATAAPPRAFVWIAGTTYDLGTLGGDYSVAYGINDIGHVVGLSRTAGGAMHAFRFHVDANGNVGARTDLGELGAGYSAAYGVNEAGHVVGTSDDRAFVWRNGTMTDLNTMIDPASGWHLSRANAINVGGSIVGEGRHDGQVRAFLLTLSADLDGDGDVDVTDMALFSQCFAGAVNPPAPTCAPGVDADFDGDGDVDTADFATLSRNFTGRL